MHSTVLDKHIEITPEICDGKPRIAGHRITVQNIVIWHERLEMSPDEIATEFDLSLGDIHAALAYYFDHQDEIDREIREEQAFAEELRGRIPSVLFRKLEKLRGGPLLEGTDDPPED